MMLSKILGDQNKTAQQISTTATLTMRMDAAGPKIAGIHLVCEAQVAGMDAAAFKTAAEEAKDKCPISNLLRPGLETLTLDATLQ
jgi:osmotically inducible protein OsmC